MKFKKIKKSFSDLFDTNRHIPLWIFSGLIVFFVLVLFLNLRPSRHSYSLGDIADKDIKAYEDFFVEDREATETNRKAAAENVPTVYDFDSLLSSKLSIAVKTAFKDVRTALESDNYRTQNIETNLQTLTEPGVSSKLKKEFEKKMGFTVPKQVFMQLEKIEFSEDVPDAVAYVLSKLLENGVAADKNFMLKEAERGIVLRDIESKNEIFTYELNSLYSPEEAKNLIRVIGHPAMKNFSPELRDAVSFFASRLIQPNITLNRNETEERIKKTTSQVNPVLYKVKAGEMLLREGEKVSEHQLLKLKALESQIKYERISAIGAGASMILLCLLFSIYIIHLKNRNEKTGEHNRKILFFAVVIIMFFLLVEISSSLSVALTRNQPFLITAPSVQLSIPVASGAMLVCLFMGLNTAVFFALAISVCSAMVFQNRFEVFIFFLLSGMMAAYWMQNCRERKVFIKSGVKLGAFNLLVAVIMNIYSADITWSKILWDSFFAFSGGVGAGIVTAGLTPFIEVTFNFSTDIKLLELASLDQPVLRRLMIEAPGTYHHSVIVGSMVEAAASEIGANPLLAKVCGYYHDIGKINKPQYFIENQSDGINKHDKLAPSMSSLILVAHVKDGVELARQHNLGREITDTISQHHGTSLIRYFYDKARQQKGEESVKIDDFRYPGSKPQTREAGLVMLADVVESASRTLESPTPARIQGLVRNLMNNVFSDGQLDNCELTLKDLHNIAKSFNTILNGIYHHRIEYTEVQAAGNGKVKDGSSDKQQAKQTQDQAIRHTADGSGHLKRLGLS